MCAGVMVESCRRVSPWRVILRCGPQGTGKENACTGSGEEEHRDFSLLSSAEAVGDRWDIWFQVR